MFDFSSALYDFPKNWIRRFVERDHTWEEACMAGKASEAELLKFLVDNNNINSLFWPLISVEQWKELVDDVRKVEARKESIRRIEGVAEISSTKGDTNITVPTEQFSSWQLYKNHLLESGFKEDAVDLIEEASIGILRKLKKHTKREEPVRGLVVGNVQSGKTANMAGLMAMAADWGWNMFIVLSGTIENLRNQTQTRLHNDLNQSGNLSWIQFDHPKKKSPPGYNLYDFNVGEYDKTRYLTVCLKIKSRLEDLIDWLQRDKNKLAQLKILVIDDEADQAGINTGDVYTDEERKTISRLLCNLVFCRNKKATSNKDNKFEGAYKAMNYISYTATPYANCLNEIGPETLYPNTFIRTLGIYPEYFGPEVLFGNNSEPEEALDIVRRIPEADRSIINAIQNGIDCEIPASLADALLWFFCCVGALRYLGYKNPLSMLVHTSQVQKCHQLVADAIKEWIRANKRQIPGRCKDLYEREIARFSKKDLRESYPNYAISDDQIWDYPDFENIEPLIGELVEEVTSIKMTEDGDLSYSRQIHLCIDNSDNSGVTEDGLHIRLAYPEENSGNAPDYATAFIVVGGNTLSRGLTIKGLVSSFFFRSVGQADTLMQMGRWFGYRRHYELFPRVWLTDKTKDFFKFLSLLDSDLRSQIQQLMNIGTPKDFRISFKTSPYSRFHLTSSSKMQMAEESDVDYSGYDTQLTVYEKDVEILKRNKEIAESFITGLGSFDKSFYKPCNYIKRDVDFATIYNAFLSKIHIASSSTAFENLDVFNKWVASVTEEGNLGKWTVILAATNSSDNGIWKISESIRLNKISRSNASDSTSTVNIGVLSDKRDYIADIEENEENRALLEEIKINNDLSKNYQLYRTKAKLDKTPLLLIYCIDKNSKATKLERTDLNLGEDAIGIAIVIPGKRSESTARRLKIKQIDLSGEGDVDENRNSI